MKKGIFRGLIVVCLIWLAIQGGVHGQRYIFNDYYEPLLNLEAEKVELLFPNISVLESSEERGILWAKDRGILYRSMDEGQTFYPIYDFGDRNIDTIKLLEGEVLLVATSFGRFNKEAKAMLMRSEDLGISFEKVLDVDAGSFYHWSIASGADGVVYASEYGYKQLPNNASKIYKSEDNGMTWKEVYDNGDHENNHLHRVHVDQQDNQIVYQAIGDGANNKMIRSTDGGQTWSTIKTMFNPTSVIQVGDKIIWGTDTHPKNGIYTMNKEGHIIKEFIPNRKYKGPIYDLIMVEGVIYGAMLSYSWDEVDWDGSIWKSEDQGETWDLFAVCKKQEHEGIGFYKMSSLNGYLYMDVSMTIKNKKTGDKIPYRGTLKLDCRKEEKKSESLSFYYH